MRIIHTYTPIRPLSEGDVIVWRMALELYKDYKYPVVLYSTTEGVREISRYGFYNYYSRVEVVDQWASRIDLPIYWAALKFKAIEEEMKIDMNFVLIDYDIIVTNRSMLQRIDNCLCAVTLEEGFRGYPDIKLDPGYTLPEYWDNSIKPFNTSIMKLPSEEVASEYLKQFYRFISYKHERHPFGNIVLIEQRMLANVLHHFGITPEIQMNTMASIYTKDFIHIWGAKGIFSCAAGHAWIKSLLCINDKLGKDCSYYSRFTVVQDTLKEWSLLRFPVEFCQWPLLEYTDNIPKGL